MKEAEGFLGKRQHMGMSVCLCVELY